MKVLVTGHRGYIGVEMVPALRAAGHEVVGLDTGLLRRVRLRRAARRRRRRSTSTSATSRRPTSKGFDAVVHLAALSNDPLGDLNSELTYDINLHASVRLAEAAKEAGVERFLFASSCSLYGAGGDDAARRERRRSTRSRRTASRRCASSRRSASSPTTRSRRCTCATPPPTACPAGCAPTSSSTTSSATPSRPARCCCRATARRGARSSTSRDIIAAFVACLAAPRDVDPRRGVQRRHERRELPDPRRRRDRRGGRARTARSTFAAGASPDTRNYRVDFSQDRRAAPRVRAAVDGARGVEELYEAFTGAGLDRGGLDRLALLPAADDPHLQDQAA